MKKIAVLLLGHKNFEQIEMFINQFDESLYDIYIHIDIKVNNLISNKSNVFVIDERHNIEWGHFSMVEAMISLLKDSYDKNYHHYIFTSGQDLLIKKSEVLYEMLISNDDNYLNFMDEKYQKKFQYRNLVNFRKFLRKQNFVSKVFRNIIFKILNFYSKLKKTNFVFGSQWSTLSNEFVQYLMNDEILNEYVRRFEKRAVPDESFFQTIFVESPFNGKLNDNLLYVDWPESSNNPKILTMADYSKLIASNKMIARKFDLEVDLEIIEKLISEV